MVTLKKASLFVKVGLKEMGYNERMVRRVYMFLNPRNINEAIEWMTEVNGLYQHDFYQSKASPRSNICFICGKERKFHRDYIPPEKNVNDNRVVRNVERVKKKYVHNNEDEECLVCLDTLPYTKLPCGH